MTDGLQCAAGVESPTDTMGMAGGRESLHENTYWVSVGHDGDGLLMAPATGQALAS
jgi:glycine/D-amino acid oxidase-like deaminating enzyme